MTTSDRPWTITTSRGGSLNDVDAGDRSSTRLSALQHDSDRHPVSPTASARRERTPSARKSSGQAISCKSSELEMLYIRSGKRTMTYLDQSLRAVDSGFHKRQSVAGLSSRRLCRPSTAWHGNR